MIRSGPLKMSDIARLADVSTSTVSRALSDNPLIPKEKRLEIQKIAEDVGYVINQSARSLRLRTTQTIAVVFPLGHDVSQAISDPFFIEMFGYLADEITNRDYQILLCRVTKTTEGWLEKIVRSQRQDGVIVVGQSDQDAAINKAAIMYKQMVVWGSDLPGQTYCSVGTDNIAGAQRGVEHLISLGRRRIAFFGMPNLPEINLRQQGYFQALGAAGITPDPALSIDVNFSYKAAYNAALNLIDSGVTFDAIFAVSDVIAMAAMDALKSRGLSIPNDIAIMGFDDIAAAAQAVPPLTTIRQDLSRAARTIVDLLFKRMAGGDAGSVTLQPALIIRTSCGVQTVQDAVMHPQ